MTGEAAGEAAEGFAWEREPGIRSFAVSAWTLLSKPSDGWPPPASTTRAFSLYGILVALGLAMFLSISVGMLLLSESGSWMFVLRRAGITLGWWTAIPLVSGLAYLGVARLLGAKPSPAAAMRVAVLSSAVPLVLYPVSQVLGFFSTVFVDDFVEVVISGLVRGGTLGLLLLVLKLRVWRAQILWDTREGGRSTVLTGLVLLALLGGYARSLWPGVSTLYDIARYGY